MESYINKVLIVDDIPENLQVLSNVLYQQGIEVGFATSGEQALEAIENIMPDLILLDVQMPEMDGFEVCNKLKSLPKTKNIPIIFLTAKTDQEDIIRGFEIGAVDYITKPFQSQELVSRVKTHLELNNSKRIIENQLIQLRQTNATKDKLFSLIAHDLKGPINALVGISDILIEDFDRLNTEQLKKMHKSIKETSVKGLKLLQNLLEWSQIQTGRIAFSPKPHSIARTVDDILQLLSLNADLKNLKIQNKCDTTHRIFFDYNMIHAVLRNLIGNSIKFSESNGEIFIESFENKDFWEIQIHDFGIGISQENIENLFKIENHSLINVTSKEKGTGLGLIICKEYIQKHLGDIWVESNQKTGTIFHFTISKQFETNNTQL